MYSVPHSSLEMQRFELRSMSSSSIAAADSDSYFTEGNHFYDPLTSPRTSDGTPLVDSVEIAKETGHSLGQKTLSFWLSFFFVINSIYGPGVLAIPIVFQQSGWLFTTICTFLFMIISCFATTCLSQAIARIPGNSNFEKRIEYGTAVRYYYGHRWASAFQICLNVTLQSYGIASIVICGQSIDQAFLSIFGRAFALQFAPEMAFTSFTRYDEMYDSSHLVLSLGYIIITLLFLPQGFLNLDDNVKTVQVASFISLFVLLGELVVYFIYEVAQNGPASVPAIGDQYSQLVSVFIFSWAFVIFIPSWLNEKRTHVSVNKVIWWSGFASFLGYVAIGLLAAVASGTISEDNILTSLSQSPTPTLTRVVAHLFSLGVIAPGIPVCSVTTRYNLFVSKLCSKRWSYFWGAVFPYLISWLFGQPQIFANLLTWPSLFFNGLVNFIIPFLMYITAMKMADEKIERKRVYAVEEVPKEVLEEMAKEEELERKLDAEDGVTHEYTTPAAKGKKSKKDIKQPLLDGDSQLTSDDHSVNGERRSSVMTSANQLLNAEELKMDEESHHAPVYPYPYRYRDHVKGITIGLMVLTCGVIITQILFDLYYLVIRGKNILDE